jgi:hypothetical protein
MTDLYKALFGDIESINYTYEATKNIPEHGIGDAVGTRTAHARLIQEIHAIETPLLPHQLGNGGAVKMESGIMESSEETHERKLDWMVVVFVALVVAMYLAG